VRALAAPAGLVALLVAAPPAAPAARATPVGVGLREFRISLYRTKVHRGVVKLNLRNFGEDVHDVAVRRAGRTYARSAPLGSDTRDVLRVRLRRPGVYTLVCLQADHARRGMRAKLRVR
jgi:hypothetical protein